MQALNVTLCSKAVGTNDTMLGMSAIDPARLSTYVLYAGVTGHAMQGHALWGPHVLPNLRT